jgi:5'-3' exonuclease
MGITGFYSLFKKSFSHAVRPKSANDHFDVVAFDMNQWMHRRFQSDPTCLAEEAVEMIRSTARDHRAKTVLVVQDGACPYPKLRLQRERREKSKRYDITVGSDFMQEFDAVLKSGLANLRLTVYYSDTKVPGEGEHKITALIKKLELRNVMVVCIDADFLVLAVLNRLKDVFVWRQCGHYYSDIVDMNKVQVENVTNFFINTCLLGNDFLPTTTLKLQNENYVDQEGNFCVENLCRGRSVNANSVSFVVYLQWCLDYYLNHQVTWIPGCEPPVQLSLAELVDSHVTIPSTARISPPAHMETMEFQLMTVLPVSHFPSYLQMYFEGMTGYLTPEIIEGFLDFWSVLFDDDIRRPICIKIYRRPKM